MEALGDARVQIRVARAEDDPDRAGERRELRHPGGREFQLVLWPGTAGQAEPVFGRPPASVTIETDDCLKSYEEPKSRGVEFVTEVLEFP